MSSIKVVFIVSLIVVPCLSLSRPVEFSLVQSLASNFEEQMEAKMSAHPELEKLAEQAELTGNGGPFFMEHIDLVEKYMTEIFLANGNSPQISDFVVSLLQLGASNGKRPVSLQLRAKAIAEFRQKWSKLPETDKNLVRRVAPSLAQVIEP